MLLAVVKDLVLDTILVLYGIVVVLMVLNFFLLLFEVVLAANAREEVEALLAEVEDSALDMLMLHRTAAVLMVSNFLLLLFETALEQNVYEVIAETLRDPKNDKEQLSMSLRLGYEAIECFTRTGLILFFCMCSWICNRWLDSDY